MFNVLRKVVDKKEGRRKIPFFLFKRTDLTVNRTEIPIYFNNDFGGDYLLRRITLRWSGETGEGIGEPIVPNYTPFATIRYLKLDQIGTGHSGTSLDPFSIADWQTYVTTTQAADTTFYVWGTAIHTGASLVFTAASYNNHYRPYQPYVYGPWRLQVYNDITYNNPPHLNGGVLYFHDAVSLIDCNTGSPMHLSNMLLIANTFTWVCSNFGGYESGGNTIDVQIMNFSGGSHCLDSIFRAPSATGGGQNLDNCVYDFVLDTSVGNYTNCQALPGAIATLPGFTSLEPEFNESQYGYITTPPNPGVTGLYPGYNSGLWGYERTAIGGLSFLGVAQQNPQPFRVSLLKKTSAHKYFEPIFANLFCSPADFKDCTTYAQPAPVDNDIFGISFKGSQRLSYKTFNWPIESDTILQLTVHKDLAISQRPNYLDTVIEGYFHETT